MGVIHIRNQFQKEYPDAELCEVRKVSQCCREIRIQMPQSESRVFYGYNTITGEFETWLCISPNKDYNQTQLQRVKGF